MNSSLPIARLRAARRSHCHTCGCSRCRRIDQLLAQAEHAAAHPETNGSWLMEGRLIADDKSGWALQSGETITPLAACLHPWAGYHVVIVVGAEALPADEPARQ